MGRNNQINRSVRRSTKKVIYLACEGGTGSTEATYIKKLCEKYDCSMVWIYKKSEPNPVVLAEYAIEFSGKQEKRGKAEIWIVFDNDLPNNVQQAYQNVTNYNNSLIKKKKNFMPVNIAFNSPSVETFGLLCCKQTKISTNKKVNQSKLRHLMPKYSHDKTPNEGPYFDFYTVESGYDFAIKRAKNWQVSLYDTDTPEHKANPFAGIYKLTESIKE